MSKKIYATLICVALLCGIVMFPASAEQEFMKLMVGKQSGKTGDIVRLPVSVENNTGFNGFTVRIEYDRDLLKLVGIEKNDSLLNGEDIVLSEDPIQGTACNYQCPQDKTYREVFPGHTIKVNNKDISDSKIGIFDKSEFENKTTIDGDLFYLDFKIVGASPRSIKTPVSISFLKFYEARLFPLFSSTSEVYFVGKWHTFRTDEGSVLIEGNDESKVTFSDLIGEYALAKIDVYYLADKGIIGGVGDGKFAPDKSVKRGDFVKMLAGVSGVDFSGEQYITDKFADVPKTHSYNKLIGWASAAGIVTGYGDKTFKMDNNISREDMAVMICRLAKYMKITLPQIANAEVFSDANEISKYTAEAITGLQQAGFIEDSFFRPKTPATRADAAKMLAMYMKLFA